MSGRLVTSLAGAIAEHVHDGDTVFVGGFGHLIPFAAIREVARQSRRGLTICRTGADIAVDELVAAGSVRHLVVGWIGNPGIGLAHATGRAVASGTTTLESWTNFSLLLRLEAARLGVPFLPTHTLSAGDIPGSGLDVRTVRCPFTGVDLVAVPALAPDVAIIHAQRASRSGAVQAWGVLGDTVTGAMASRRIVVTVEELVDDAVVSAAPDRTILPSHRVSAIVVVPGGARPSWAEGFYDRDEAAYEAYDEVAREPASLATHLSQVVGDTR